MDDSPTPPAPTARTTPSAGDAGRVLDPSEGVRGLERGDVPWLLERFAQTQDNAYAEAVIELYRPLAISRARRMCRPEVEMDDLVQVALMAMWKAVGRFDPDKGASFATYAVRTMDGELKRHYRDRVWGVRVPRGLKANSLAVTRARRGFVAEHDHEPSIDELAEYAGLTAEEVAEGLEVARAYRTASLDAPVGDGATTRGDLIPGREESGDRDGMVDVLASINRLPERQRHITYLRYYRDMTQQEIADIVGCSQMHVSRLLRRAVQSMQADLEVRATPVA